jgi:hypothetical protein
MSGATGSGSASKIAETRGRIHVYNRPGDCYPARYVLVVMGR